MKTKRHKLPPAKVPAPKTEASMVPNVEPGASAGDKEEDEEQLVRTSEAAHKLGVSENTVRKYMKMGLLDRKLLGTRTIRTTRRSLSRLMGQQQAAE